jgi:anti-anti-sigma factor
MHPPESRRELRKRPSLLDVSLRGVSFMDTVGPAVLVEAAKWARGEHVCLRFADPSSAVLGMLALAHLKDFFPSNDDSTYEGKNPQET